MQAEQTAIESRLAGKAGTGNISVKMQKASFHCAWEDERCLRIALREMKTSRLPATAWQNC
jgi:hypothetical protein